MPTVTRSKTTKPAAKAAPAPAPKARAAALTVAQLKQAASMKIKGSTWQDVRDHFGVSTSSGRFLELFEENGIEGPAVRQRGAVAPAAKTTKANAKPAAKAPAKKTVVKRAKATANPS